MSPASDEIGRSAFADARADRRRASIGADREARQGARLALEEAHERFAEQAVQTYAGGADAARRDGDRLEDIADQLTATIKALEPLFDRLDIARDQAAYRGLVLHRARSIFNAARLSDLMAEALAEALLSGPAGGVLVAAVRQRTI